MTTGSVMSAITRSLPLHSNLHGLGTYRHIELEGTFEWCVTRRCAQVSCVGCAGCSSSGRLSGFGVAACAVRFLRGFPGTI